MRCGSEIASFWRRLSDRLSPCFFCCIRTTLNSNTPTTGTSGPPPAATQGRAFSLWSSLHYYRPGNMLREALCVQKLIPLEEQLAWILFLASSVNQFSMVEREGQRGQEIYRSVYFHPDVFVYLDTKYRVFRRRRCAYCGLTS